MPQDNDLPDKEYLERQKLVAELIKLENDAKYELIRMVFSGLQAFAVIIGVYLGVNEFVVKDRTQKTQHQSIALTLIERVDSPDVRTALDALERLRDDAYTVPNNDDLLKKDEKFRPIRVRFEKQTRSLTTYFKMLNNGIKAGYLDPDLVVALLADEIRSVDKTLDDLVVQMGGKSNAKIIMYPDLKPFCDFYELQERLDKYKRWKDYGAIDPCKS